MWYTGDVVCSLIWCRISSSDTTETCRGNPSTDLIWNSLCCQGAKEPMEAQIDWIETYGLEICLVMTHDIFILTSFSTSCHSIAGMRWRTHCKNNTPGDCLDVHSKIICFDFFLVRCPLLSRILCGWDRTHRCLRQSVLWIHSLTWMALSSMTIW